MKFPLGFFGGICVAVVVLFSCDREPFVFTAVSEPGFCAEDHQRDRNDYPWAMKYFSPDTADGSGRLYVGTGNGVMGSMMKRIFAELGLEFTPNPYILPPEIRRYRPDLGEMVWETVLDYREIEQEPDWETSGIRTLGVYTTPDGIRYLYAGTFGLVPSVWRSRTGDSGTWEKVWSTPVPGSIRSFAEHGGMLYFAVTHEVIFEAQKPGKIYATDGEALWAVVENGFGNGNNIGIFEIVSFEGYLYAGTYNKADGYEIWRLDPANEAFTPELIVENGGPSPSNQSVSAMKPFNGHLYVGALIAAGINTAGGFPIRGADMIRIDADGSWETVVGPGALTPSGFGKPTNAYLWTLEQYNGRLYCGVWDSLSFLRVTETYMPQIIEQFPDMTLWDVIEIIRDRFGSRSTGAQTIGNNIWQEGGALYVSDDGLNWQPVFSDGLGNVRNFGVRQLEVMDGHLYLGLSNIWDGLMIYKMTAP